MYGVTSYCFGRHGFAVLGDNAEGETLEGEPDFWSIQNSFANGNRGYGLYISGGDSNAGESIALKTTGNQLGGIYDHSDWTTPTSVRQVTWIIAIQFCWSRHPITPFRRRTESATWPAIRYEGIDREEYLDHCFRRPPTDKNFDGTYPCVNSRECIRILAYPCNTSGGPARGGTVAKASSTEVYAAYHARGHTDGSYLGRGVPRVLFGSIPIASPIQMLPILVLRRLSSGEAVKTM